MIAAVATLRSLPPSGFRHISCSTRVFVQELPIQGNKVNAGVATSFAREWATSKTRRPLAGGELSVRRSDDASTKRFVLVLGGECIILPLFPCCRAAGVALP